MSLRASTLLSACLQLSFHAGSAIRQIHASGALDTRDKGQNDPVTLADLTSQKIITASLQKYFPSVRVIGEEDVAGDPLTEARDVDLEAVPGDLLPPAIRELTASDLIVWVDPLDGTQGFVEADCYGVTTLIGIAYRGTPLFGFIHEPFSNPPSTYWGGAAMGVRRCTGEGLGDLVTAVQCPHPTIITSVHHCKPQDLEFLKSVGEVKSCPGCGYKTLLVVRGEVRAYAFPRSGTSRWDVCAGEAIVKELGGMFTDMLGNSIAYNPQPPYRNSSGPLVTFDPALHTRIVQHFLSYQSAL